MKKIIFYLLVLIAISCKKDVDLDDSRLDCKAWEVTLIDFQGNILGDINKKDYKNSIYYKEDQSYCEFLERWMASENSLIRH